MKPIDVKKIVGEVIHAYHERALAHPGTDLDGPSFGPEIEKGIREGITQERDRWKRAVRAYLQAQMVMNSWHESGVENISERVALDYQRAESVFNAARAELLELLQEDEP